MEKLKIHDGFKLNGKSFKDTKELLSYIVIESIEGKEFIDSWFDDSEFVIAHTSGSTGTPKEIKIKKSQMLNSAASTGDYFNLRKGTTALLCMSSNFIAGKMMWVRALSLGWELDVVSVNSHPLEGINKKYDFSAMVPLQVFNSIEKLNRIGTLIIGGGVVSVELQEQLQLLKTKAFATYGMTETVTHIAVKKLNHILSNDEGFYHTLPSVKIAKDTRECLVINAPLIADQKVVTNDLVRIISETSFEWLGRFDSIINSGGVKLIPEKIEHKISKILTGNFFIGGKEDLLLGEKVALLIEGKGASLTESTEIKKYLKDAELSNYEFPKEIHFIEKFDMTETGKIKRASILARLV